MWLEIREDRMESLKWALEGIKHLLKLQFQLGMERGHSALVRLASGETSVKSYEEDRFRRFGK